MAQGREAWTQRAGAAVSALEVRSCGELSPEAFPPLLRAGPVRIGGLMEAAAHPVDAAKELLAHLHALADARLITFAAGSGPTCFAELRTVAPGFRLTALPHGTLVLSRFANMRADDGALMLETPLGVGAVRIRHPSALTALGALASGADAASLISDSELPGEMQAFLELLVSSAIASASQDGRTADADETPALQQWEFHDLLFHHRSRLGRHDGDMGATFRFLDRIEPPPCVAERPFTTTIPFTRPSRPLPLDPGLPRLLGRRTSVREHAQLPISSRELGDFLYHCARVVEVLPGPHGPFTRRPYPNGGASYELEVYLVVSRCMGVASGFYYYDAAAHGLASLRPPNADTEALLDHAYIASGQTCRPQVLLMLASRFQRVSWKYAGMAYATTLKNVGALYATMYLVATAMGLAPCALGVGDSERFTRLAGTDRYTEATVGEFMLGSAA